MDASSGGVLLDTGDLCSGLARKKTGLGRRLEEDREDQRGGGGGEMKIKIHGPHG